MEHWGIWNDCKYIIRCMFWNCVVDSSDSVRQVNIMSKEQILEKYGNVKLKFSSYYKYTFTFVGIADDGAQIRTSIGGDSGDIYKMDVDADSEETLIDMDTECATVTMNGEKIGNYDERW